MARALLFPEVKISPESRIFYSDASYQGKLCLSLFSNSDNRLQRRSRNSVSKPISYRQFTQLTFTTNCWSKGGKKVHIQGLWSRMWLLSTFASCFKETRCCVHVCVAFKGCVKLLFIHANPHHWDATHIKSALTQETRHLSAKQSRSGNFFVGSLEFILSVFPKSIMGRILCGVRGGHQPFRKGELIHWLPGLYNYTCNQHFLTNHELCFITFVQVISYAILNKNQLIFSNKSSHILKASLYV